MSSNTKVYEDKMKSSVEHLGRELGAVRAGRANPAVLDRSAWIIMVPPLPSSRWHPWLWPKHAP